MKEDTLNIIIGTVDSVEKVAGTDRLFLVRINAGRRNYQIATSLASYYKEQELVGQQVPIKVDVKPKKIRGVLSDARFIAIMNENKEPVLLLPEHRVSNGSIVV